MSDSGNWRIPTAAEFCLMAIRWRAHTQTVNIAVATLDRRARAAGTERREAA